MSAGLYSNLFPYNRIVMTMLEIMATQCAERALQVVVILLGGGSANNGMYVVSYVICI
jgi:hypothetical protein